MSVGLFVDLEGVAVDLFTAKIPDVRVVTVLPPDIEGQELIRVTKSPGSNTDQTNNPHLDVECFAPDRIRMWVLAGRANNALAEISGDTYAGVQIDAVHTINDPVPGWWSPTVQRAVAVYRFDLRVFA